MLSVKLGWAYCMIWNRESQDQLRLELHQMFKMVLGAARLSAYWIHTLMGNSIVLFVVFFSGVLSLTQEPHNGRLIGSWNRWKQMQKRRQQRRRTDTTGQTERTRETWRPRQTNVIRGNLYNRQAAKLGKMDRTKGKRYNQGKVEEKR